VKAGSKTAPPESERDFFPRALDRRIYSDTEQEPTKVNCPKCGFLQEERLDCKKCGVVFSKYIALHNQEKQLQSDSREASSPLPQFASAEPYLPDLAEMRQSLKEMGRRLSETEFERAERVRISGELRSLDQKFQDLQVQFASSIAGLEEKAENMVSSTLPTEEDLRKLSLELIEAYLDPLLKRLDQVEQKVEKRQNGNSKGMQADVHFQNALQGLEQRMAALEKTEPKDAEFVAPDTKGALDQEKILKEFEDIRFSLQNATLKYSEIGELKKNHLVLMSKIESIQQEQDSSKKERSEAVSNKISEIETEVLALRAEVRQAIKSLETIESSALLSMQAIQSLEQEVGTFKEAQENEPQRIQAVIAGFETSQAQKLSPLTALPEDLKWVAKRCQLLEENLARVGQDVDGFDKKSSEMDSSIAGIMEDARQVRSELVALTERFDIFMSQPLPEPRSSTEDDMRAIRGDIHRILEIVLKPVAR
jgi:archaellum component FlaC